MPRQEITIENFSAGIITTVDAQDTPINSASWSVDQDPEAPEGVLRGREGDDSYIDSADNHKGSFVGWIVNDTQRDMLFYSKTTGELSSIKDFFSAKTFANHATLSTDLTVSIESINKAARIGYGNNAVKYLGYIDHGQFGGSAPSGLQYVDSILSNINELPRFEKVVSDGTSHYGIEWQGKHIFKLTPSTGAITKISLQFSMLQGIAYDSTGSFLYVYDKRAGTYGSIYKVDPATLTQVGTYPLSGFGGVGGNGGNASENGHVTDIEFSKDNTILYMTMQKTDGTAWSASAAYTSATTGFIWSYAKASFSNTVSFYPLSNTPYCQAHAATNAQGYFSTSATNTTVNIPRRALVKLAHGTTNVGVLLKIDAEMTEDAAGTVNVAPGPCILIINNSFTQGTLWMSANSNIVKLSGSTTPTCGSLFNYTSGGIQYDVLMTVIGSNNVAYRSRYDVATPYYEELSLDLAGNGRDFDWVTNDAIGVMSDTSSEALKDSAATASIVYKSYNTNIHEYYVYCNSTSEVARVYLYQCQEQSSFFSGASATYIKRSDLFISVEEVSYVGGAFDTGKRYYYRVVLVYQDYQYSPLYKTTMATGIDPTTATNAQKITINISNAASLLNKRVTAVAVFRAESDDALVAPTTSYRLVDYINLRQSWSGDTTSVFGTWYINTIYDTGNYGVTYESEAGISETLPNNYMRYTIATQGNGYMFVGQCANEEFDSGSITNIIFRSKKNAPDTFDWSNDFLVLPTKPTALHFFRNLLFAFDTDAVYVIDPESFSLIAVQNGYGCSDPNHVVSNNELMVFANTNNIYAHDGQNINILSRAINTSQFTSIDSLTVSTHRGLMASYSLSIAFMSKKNSIVFCYTKTSSTPLCFVFHIPTKSWHYWEVVKIGVDLISYGSGSKVIFSDYLGNTYLSTEGGIVRIATNATRFSCSWISRQFNCGDVTGIKKFLKIILNTPYAVSTVTTKKYALNANTTFIPTFTSGSYLSDSTTKATNIWIRIGLGATEQLQGITLIFRRMIGIR